MVNHTTEEQKQAAKSARNARAHAKAKNKQLLGNEIQELLQEYRKRHGDGVTEENLIAKFRSFILEETEGATAVPLRRSPRLNTTKEHDQQGVDGTLHATVENTGHEQERAILRRSPRLNTPNIGGNAIVAENFTGNSSEGNGNDTRDEDADEWAGIPAQVHDSTTYDFAGSDRTIDAQIEPDLTAVYEATGGTQPSNATDIPGILRTPEADATLALDEPEESEIWDATEDLTCSCQPYLSLHDREQSMSEISEQLMEKFPVPDDGEVMVPLGVKEGRLNHARIPAALDLRAVLTGGGTETRSALSLQKSQQELVEDPAFDVKLIKKYDVDSFFSLLPTLGVCKQGIRIYYYPLFTQQVEQCTHLPGELSNIHKRLNFRFASPNQWTDMQIYMVFPSYKPKGNESSNFPTDEIFRYLTDEVFLPWVKRQETQLRSRHPRDFDDLRSKALVKREYRREDLKGYNVVNYHHIPEDLADDFWAHVKLSLKKEHLAPPFRDLHDPILVAMSHGFKQRYAHINPEVTRRMFDEQLNSTFFIGEDSLPHDQIYVDLGAEVIPEVGESGIPVALLPKRNCNTAWAGRMQAPHSGGSPAAPHQYHWLGTRDAAGAEVIPRREKHSSEQSKFHFNKRYATWKDHFAVNPVRGGEFFTNEQDLALTTMSEANAENALRYLKGVPPAEKEKVKKSRQRYLRGKNRMFTALSSSIKQGSSWQCRSEYRVSYDFFQRLAMRAQEPLDLREHRGLFDHESDVHLPFWVLRSSDVNTFAMATLNRFLLPLEVMMSSTDVVPDGPAPSSDGEQLSNMPLALALGACLKSIASGGDLSRHNKIWKGRHINKSRIEGELPADDDEALRRGLLRRGLDFEESLRDTGMVWLPDDLLRFNPLQFDYEACDHIAFLYGGLEVVPIHTAKAREKLTRQSRMYGLLEDILRTREPESGREFERLLWLAAELVVQQFVKDVLHILAERSTKTRRVRRAAGVLPKSNVRRQAPQPSEDADDAADQAEEEMRDALGALSEDERQGLCGLTEDIVQRATGVEELELSFPRLAHKGDSLFDQYVQDGTWSSRMKVYFAWDDKPPGVAKGRTWDEKHEYRLMAKRIHAMIKAAHGEDWAAVFAEHSIPEAAAVALWAVPRAEVDRLCAMKRPSKHNSDRSRQAIREESQLANTQWIVCSIPEMRKMRLMRDYPKMSNYDKHKLKLLMASLKHVANEQTARDTSMVPSARTVEFCQEYAMQKAKRFWGKLDGDRTVTARQGSASSPIIIE